MKDEIKEIIDNLIRFRNENSKFQPEDILTIEDVWLLLDYITNLQEENKKLSKEIKKNKKEDDEIRNKNCFLVNGFHELEERINKAIEYIQNSLILTDSFNIYEDGAKELLNILQGENDDRRNME